MITTTSPSRTYPAASSDPVPIRRCISTALIAPPPSISMMAGMVRNTSMASSGADDPGLDAEAQEMLLEFTRDELVRGADEMQHLDDVAVRRHGALGGGDDDRCGGGGDEQEDGDAAERERAA